MSTWSAIVQYGTIIPSEPEHPLAVAIEGFGFSSVSISVMGLLLEQEAAFPAAGIWYLPSDLIIRVSFGKERARQTYKIWPSTERIVAKFEGLEGMTKSVKAKLVSDKKENLFTIIRADKYEDKET